MPKIIKSKKATAKIDIGLKQAIISQFFKRQPQQPSSGKILETESTFNTQNKVDEYKTEIKTDLSEIRKKSDDIDEKVVKVLKEYNRESCIKTDQLTIYDNVKSNTENYPPNLDKDEEELSRCKRVKLSCTEKTVNKGSTCNESSNNDKSIFEFDNNGLCSNEFKESDEFSSYSYDHELFDEDVMQNIMQIDWDSNNKKLSLNLHEFQYCTIIGIEEKGEQIALNLKGDSEAESICDIQGHWRNTNLNIGDRISVKAYFEGDKWIVNDQEGIIVKHPDKLISGTSIVGSLFCLRKSVLTNLFPGSDPPNFQMTIGCLLHDLLQQVLRTNVRSVNDIKKIIVQILNNPGTVRCLYECGCTISAAKKELHDFIPLIHKFMNDYVKPVSGKNIKTWPGEITEIQDIEENFWIPSLGIKGKADVTVKTKCNGKIKIMPLELKTGRASNSSEHRGQVILYAMMMTALGNDVQSGLLLYLREDIMKEINVKHSECTGLISLRNELADYLTANEKNVNDDECWTVLPQPINHHNACSKCSYLTVCSAALKENPNSLPPDNPLNLLSVCAIHHLSSNHIRFFFHWSKLLRMEEEERKRTKYTNVADIWRVNPSRREMRGNCMANVRIEGNVKENENGRYDHCMSKQVVERSLLKYGLVNGDYVAVSSDERYAIATGYVMNVTESNIFLNLDRNLDKRVEKVFHIDAYTSDGLLGLNLSNLMLMLDNGIIATNMRSLIIDGRLPTFSNKCNSSSIPITDILSPLNECQKNAVTKVLAADDYLLIKGMPGTGKTATLVALIKYLVRLNQSVLITSHTHSAVDNLLLKLDNEVDFLRIGSTSKVHVNIRPYCESVLLESMQINDIELLDHFYKTKQVVAATCMGCNHIILKKRIFDVCIIDEATQVMLPSTLAPLFSARKFVLVGDPDQLPPVVLSKKAADEGLKESLFARLDKPEVCALLHLQYRMNERIMDIANAFTYDGLLKSGHENVAKATIPILQPPINVCDWLKWVLSNKMEDSVILLDTSDLYVNGLCDETSECTNMTEGKIILCIIQSLKQCGINEDTIGVISPYREQVELLDKIMLEKKHKVEVKTVDQYQGRDKSVILYSCTRFTKTKEGGIMSDKRRLTVAITRAKHKLVIVGNLNILKSFNVFDELIFLIPSRNIIKINKIDL